MSRVALPILLLVVLEAMFVNGLRTDAASKTDAPPATIPKPGPPAAPHLPVPHPPVASRPPTASQRPVPSIERDTQPEKPYPSPVFPEVPGATTAAPGNVPVKSYPPPSKPAWTREPAEIPYLQTVIVSFPKGDKTASAQLFAVDGRRVEISHYDVQWFLPNGQTGTISLSPPLPERPEHPRGNLSFGPEPGYPVTIYGTRTGTDGSARAMLFFYGRQTPVPREEKNPTDL